jgi:site-specific recombinase XerD
MASRVQDQRPTLGGLRRGEGAGLRAGWELVQVQWRDAQVMSEQTQARLTELGNRFVRRLEATGLSSWAEVDARVCRDFVTAPTVAAANPSSATQQLRRSTLRAMFRCLRELGCVHGDPTLDLKLAARGVRRYRPLTDDEVVLCRVSARLGQGGSRSLLRAVAWSLGEATAATSEIGAVRLEDLHPGAAPTNVYLRGSRRYRTRIGALSEWGAAVLARQAQQLRRADPGSGSLLAYGGAGPAGAYLAQASVCTQLTRVLDPTSTTSASSRWGE